MFRMHAGRGVIGSQLFERCQGVSSLGAGVALRVALVAHWDWVLYNFRLPLARSLRKAGCEVVLVAPFGQFLEGLRAEGFDCIHWQVDRRGLSPLAEIQSVARLIGIYRREQFDCVHHFTIKPCLYGSIASFFTNASTINNFTGLGFLYTDAPLARWLRRLLLPVLGLVLRGGQSVVLLQNVEDRNRFVSAGLVTEDKALVIRGSGVDAERFRPASSDGPGGASAVPVVAMAGRLIKDKGVGEFVEAARLLLARGFEARFIVAGELDAGNPNCIESGLLESWKREGVVEFIGQCSDMPDFLRRTHVAVLPTTYGEGLPKFLLEAAATGLPIVATDIEGCRLVVRHRENGLLVPPKDVAALAAAIAELLRDREMAGAMGRTGRRLVLAEFVEARIMEQYLEVYRCMGLLDCSDSAESS